MAIPFGRLSAKTAPYINIVPRKKKRKNVLVSFVLADLKFVQGAVAKKNFFPELTHFKIEGGTIRSHNGTLALSCPIDLDIDCTPKAVPFVKAIQNCKETVTMTMSKAGRLRIVSGPFKAFIPCIEETEDRHAMPEGELLDIDGESLLKAIISLNPFIGDDASKPWSNGVLLKGQSAFATNNIAIGEYWIGTEFPLVCTIPKMAIREMIRVGEAPEKVQMGKNSISFHYAGEKWIRTALLSTDWPDLSPLLDNPSNPEKITEKLYEGLEVIRPFLDKQERVYLEKGFLKTSPVEGEGATYEIEDFPHSGVYHFKILKLLQGLVTTIDFSTYPKPCLFFGEKLRGAIIGMRA